MSNWSLAPLSSHVMIPDSELRSANWLSQFKPAARDDLLALLLTPGFKTKNLTKLNQAKEFLVMCSDIDQNDGDRLLFRCTLAMNDSPNQCGVTFDRRDRFADHLHQHLGMKPYICQCGVDTWLVFLYSHFS
jgi:hypothetical protein